MKMRQCFSLITAIVISGFSHYGSAGARADAAPEFSRQTTAPFGVGQGYTCNPSPPAPVFPPGIDQIGDPSYCPTISNPAFPFGAGPRILFDEGHNNWGTITPLPRSPSAGSYYALAELLRADGFVVDAHQGSFDGATLANYQILILSHPLREPYYVYDESWQKWRYNPAAFTPGSSYSAEEISAIREWVHRGGSLLINAEHLPFTGAALALTETFGMSLGENALGGFSTHFQKSTPSHAIFRGKDISESISDIPYVAGGTRIISELATPLFEYPPFSLGIDISIKGYIASFELLECNAQQRPREECDKFAAIQSQETIYFYAAGDVAAATANYGKGRVALFTEFATFTVQLVDSNLDGVADTKLGGLKPGDGDFTQIILNTFRWLAGSVDQSAPVPISLFGFLSRSGQLDLSVFLEQSLPECTVTLMGSAQPDGVTSGYELISFAPDTPVTIVSGKIRRKARMIEQLTKKKFVKHQAYITAVIDCPSGATGVSSAIRISPDRIKSRHRAISLDKWFALAGDVLIARD